MYVCVCVCARVCVYVSAPRQYLEHLEHLAARYLVSLFSKFYEPINFRVTTSMSWRDVMCDPKNVTSLNKPDNAVLCIEKS